RTCGRAATGGAHPTRRRPGGCASGSCYPGFRLRPRPAHASTLEHRSEWGRGHGWPWTPRPRRREAERRGLDRGRGYRPRHPSRGALAHLSTLFLEETWRDRAWVGHCAADHFRPWRAHRSRVATWAGQPLYHLLASGGGIGYGGYLSG